METLSRGALVALLALSWTACNSDPEEAAPAAPPTSGPGASASSEVKRTGKTNDGCDGPDECESKVCSPERKCAAPSPTDGVKNGDESDVDCGGTSAPKCAVDKSCNAHRDCASDGCDDRKKCAIARSCTQESGGRTCGSGEVGAPDAKHESCCKALPIPGTKTRLDKYKVTAGRMRAFVERVKGDVVGWYDANRASLSEEARKQIEPYKDKLPSSVDEVNYQLGGAAILPDRPSTLQGCFTGSAKNPAYGAHTYWTPDDPNLAEGDREDRAFDQAFLDRLPLNCVPYPIVAAFCAWDGGRLQTYEENSTAYGSGAYPWGNTPVAGGFADLNGAWSEYGPANYPATPAACPSCNTALMNWSNNYQFPSGGIASKPWDYAYFISAPGRFPKDVGAGGHMDLGGVMMELTASPGVPQPNLPAVDPKYGPTIRWSRAGSWEGVHPANYDRWQFAIMTKYGKTGARCARD